MVRVEERGAYRTGRGKYDYLERRIVYCVKTLDTIERILSFLHDRKYNLHRTRVD